MIISQDVKHGRTINDLSRDGVIPQVVIVFSNGSIAECNSTWTATEHLKNAGFYNQRDVTWKIVDADEFWSGFEVPHGLYDFDLDRPAA